jgi:hypothetical protein
LWLDAPTFDVADHVLVRQLPPHADRAGLLQACEQLRQRPFIRGRPLWQLWLLPGLADGQVGMFIKVQHARPDGVSGMVMLGNLLGSAPFAAAADTPAWTPRPMPTMRDLWLDNMRHGSVALSVPLVGQA